MALRIILFFAILLLTEPCFSQSRYIGAVNAVKASNANTIRTATKTQTKTNEIPTSYKDSEESALMEEKINNMSGFMGNSKNDIRARNLLMLKYIVDYKLQDETLKPYITNLQNNREFNTKLHNALNQLDNKANRIGKDQKIMNILNDSGNRIYNSLAN